MRGAFDVPDDVESLLPALYDRHAGNLRNALRELYDLYAADRIESDSEVGPVCRTGPEARQRRTARSRSASGTYRSGFPPSRE